MVSILLLIDLEDNRVEITWKVHAVSLEKLDGQYFVCLDNTVARA
jgi:hypothetical protein